MLIVRIRWRLEMQMQMGPCADGAVRVAVRFRPSTLLVSTSRVALDRRRLFLIGSDYFTYRRGCCLLSTANRIANSPPPPCPPPPPHDPTGDRPTDAWVDVVVWTSESEDAARSSDHRCRGSTPKFWLESVALALAHATIWGAVLYGAILTAHPSTSQIAFKDDTNHENGRPQGAAQGIELL